jgi:hypothetical protein
MIALIQRMQQPSIQGAEEMDKLSEGPAAGMAGCNWQHVQQLMQ